MTTGPDRIPPVYPVDLSARHAYRFTLEQCDVRPEVRDSLTIYREKRQEWFHLLDGDPEHSIHLQISGMMWADAAYRTMNEARRYATEQNPTAAVAPLLAEALDHGYVATMILAIGRLTDAEAKNPLKDVVSLSAILADMKRHRGLITREFFVCYDGLPYDPVLSAERYYRENPIVPGKYTWMPNDGPDASDTAECVHAAFDLLSGVGKAERDRDDLILEVTFDDIAALLNAPDIKYCKNIRDKFVAHAATVYSRNAANIAEFDITLDRIASAQRSLILANHRMRRDILWDGAGDPIPTPQFDQFVHLDRPFVPPERVKELSRWWDEHAADRAEWLK